MKKLRLLAILLIPLNNAFADVEPVRRANAICYIQKNAPDLVFGRLPFSCQGRPEKFVATVKRELYFLSETNLIPHFDKCLPSLKKKENMVMVARLVWDYRDSSLMSENAATAFAIANVCEMLGRP